MTSIRCRPIFHYDSRSAVRRSVPLSHSPVKDENGSEADRTGVNLLIALLGTEHLASVDSWTLKNQKVPGSGAIF